MKEKNTEYGKLCIGTKQEVFDKAIALADTHRRENNLKELTWALTGGSTPMAFYEYCAGGGKIPQELLDMSCWLTSDERLVNLESSESNFGNAARAMLDPLKVSKDRRYPWPVEREPDDAASLFNAAWQANFSEFRCFDLCFLGMGDDCHIASIFPFGPLTGEDQGQNFFTHVQVPGKGPRLTITQKGLENCGLIVVMVLGKNKAIPLYRVFNELYSPRERPAQLLLNNAPRTVWLVDEEAASELKD